ncbi:hypothetical protein HAX54_045982 [Datura stramonium]|uniref:Uncharacterized protein n=1 Tax=Datura stramonium TaxID=4076 RepID=A0ABS8RQE6_DATST|nr:hypothetical protein [Datura stramonium]
MFADQNLPSLQPPLSLPYRTTYLPRLPIPHRPLWKTPPARLGTRHFTTLSLVSNGEPHPLAHVSPLSLWQKSHQPIILCPHFSLPFPLHKSDHHLPAEALLQCLSTQDKGRFSCGWFSLSVALLALGQVVLAPVVGGLAVFAGGMAMNV